jgi:4-diphosphocytidyl-2-C-methyl-D-erythritol kinase
VRSATDVPAVRVRVPSKINLQLAVGPRRSDGYHELRTVFQALDLCDEIQASPADGLHLSVSGSEATGVPTDSGNLAWQAAQRLAEHLGIAPNVHLQIAKSIPVAAGLAGGSADAAGALLACAQLWHHHPGQGELVELASLVGSDVAFCVVGGTALGTGRGEQLAPVLATGTFWWVLAVADGGLSTSAVYREFDRQNQGSRVAVADVDVLDAVRGGDVDALARAVSNDLQPAALALAPALRRTLAAGRELGGLAALVCGSGPTCAFLAADHDHALQLASALSAEGVCRTTRVASGPAPGARVVH